jgi:uncharacterized protein (TIGR03790 family)
VILLANADDPGSLQVAQHYAKVRHVPSANIIALPMPQVETVTWHDFVTAIWNPLIARLVHEGWIDAIGFDLTDSVGRRKYVVSGHRIAALVVCRGVPLRIANDPALFAEVLPLTRHPEYRTNQGAVDAELTLLPVPNYPINAFLPNPLFGGTRPNPYAEAQIVKVSRLDGPSVEDAMALVDHAVAAERDGLLGRAYFDVGGPYPTGDRWIEAAAKTVSQLGFDTHTDREPSTFAIDARMDAPVLYAGWYTHDLAGPFTLPGFRFPPGAIAIHLHSYSAETMRSTTAGWAGPLVARGVTATVGNVNEPYLDFMHRPDLIFASLARGATLVDAAYGALPVLSWQEILIGDPLYRPFAVPLEQQLQRVERLPAHLAGYAVLRHVHLLDAAGQSGEATAWLRKMQRERPTLAGAVALAERLRAAGDTKGAGEALAALGEVAEFATDQWALARTAAKLLSECGRGDAAAALWRVLLRNENIPTELRIAWLREAEAMARAAGDETQAAAWHTELEALSTPNAN